MTYLYRIRCDTLIRIPGDRRLYTYRYLRIAFGQLPINLGSIDLVVHGERSLNPLPDEASRTTRETPEKKRPASRVFFFLPAFGRCCPSVSAHPANRIRYSSNIAIADHFPSKTFSFKHHLTGKAWPACRAILPFHSNTTRQARHGQLAEQFYLFKHHLRQLQARAKNRHLNLGL